MLTKEQIENLKRLAKLHGRLREPDCSMLCDMALQSIAGKPHKGLELPDRSEIEATLQESLDHRCSCGDGEQGEICCKHCGYWEQAMRMIDRLHAASALHSAASEQQSGDSTVLRSECPTEHPGAVERDAMRYRFLRRGDTETGILFDNEGQMLETSALDAAIDAALAAGERQR